MRNKLILDINSCSLAYDNCTSNLNLKLNSNLGSINYIQTLKSIALCENDSYFSKQKLVCLPLKNLVRYAKSIVKGYSVELSLIGLGFKVLRNKKAKELLFELHFSHKLIYKIPNDIAVRTAKKKLIIFGLDKSHVVNTANEIKNLRYPNIYKGKGIRYTNESIKLKPGKQR